MKKLYLLPNVLDETGLWHFTPPSLDALIAESEAGARKYCKRFSLGSLPVYLLNEHTQNVADLLKIPESVVGLISDAGLPSVADPGASLTYLARQQGVEIEALIGPSSILQALLLSGFPAQKFTFWGYLHREKDVRSKEIRLLSPGMTHIFIETPYRNRQFLEALLSQLNPRDLLAVAWNLTGKEEGVISLPVSKWKTKPDIHKKPAVFLVYKDAK